MFVNLFQNDRTVTRAENVSYCSNYEFCLLYCLYDSILCRILLQLISFFLIILLITKIQL